MSWQVELYRYVRYCLYAHHGRDQVHLATTRDLQHDIYLYLVDVKGVIDFNAGSRRLTWLLAKYRPQYLKMYLYRNHLEQVLLNEDGQPTEVGVSREMTGDVAHDLDLLRTKPRVDPLVLPINNARAVTVDYVDGRQRQYSSVTDLCDKEGVSEYTAWGWLKRGKGSSQQVKFAHIKKVSYMDYVNPFPGSKTQIKQRPMSEDSWRRFIRRRNNRANFTLEDNNEFVKLYVHKSLGHGILVKVSNPNGAEHYIKRGVDNGTI